MQASIQESVVFVQPQLANPEKWFAVQTRPRHEKRVVLKLEEKGVVVFLPLYSAVHQWSDRRQKVQLPLFPNYVFVRIGASRSTRTEVLQTDGVTSFVGMRRAGVCIPDVEIESIQRVLSEQISFTSYPFLNIGQKVRIRGGSLDGVHGILTVNNGRSLIVSVECIQRSLAICIDGYRVEAA